MDNWREEDNNKKWRIGGEKKRKVEKLEGEKKWRIGGRKKRRGNNWEQNVAWRCAVAQVGKL